MRKKAGSRLVHRKSGDDSKMQRLGAYLLESLLTSEEEDRASAYRVCLSPHQHSRESYHRVAEEFYFVISGRGAAVLDGREHELSPGDFLRLPPGTRHVFVSGDQPLDLLNIHIPGCRPDHDTYFTDSEDAALPQSKENFRPGRRSSRGA
jgi:mannose-6-phosphate isomerase-like protein (cupin superfamily)